jgi:hypothetical protein
MYSLDTSFFMDWQGRHYPLDVFPSLARRIEDMVAGSGCGAVELVREEIDAVGTPGLRAWARNVGGLFTPLTTDVQLEAAAIEASYPDLMDPKGLHLSADAYVIALAKIQEGVVVSQETSAQEKHRPRRQYFIPDVCRDLGLPCVNLLGLMRREKWIF